MTSSNRALEAESERAASTRIRILLVDDSDLSRDHFTRVLEQVPSVELVVATAGATALRALAEGGISIVICDYAMPDMSGLQVLRFIRRTHSPVALPVLMLTASDDPDVKVQAFRFGANDYIAKQAAPEELLARVGTQIELLQAHRRWNDSRLRRSEQQKFETIGHLAKGLAHELNTPAQYIMSNLQFLAESFEKLAATFAELRALPSVDHEHLEAVLARVDFAYLQAEIPRCIGESTQGIEQMARVITLMREFARPGLPERSLHSLNEIIRGTLAVTRGQWYQLAEVELELSESLPEVSCVGLAIKQVVLYAILNAIKAISRSGLAERRKNQLRIVTRTDANWAVIEISDTGRGMADTMVQRVMDPVLSAIENEQSGQALAHARTVIVDQHHGRFDVRSSAQGTSLMIRLPLDVDDQDVTCDDGANTN